MKRVLFGAAAIAALSISAIARDDRLPANFVGDWCFAEHTADHLAFYRRAIWHSIVAVAARVPPTMMIG
jgi:hypothetical protein